MPQAFTVISARFGHDLSASDDESGAPDGALFAMAGSEADWRDDGGFSRRRDVRTWLALWPDRDAARRYLDQRLSRIPLLVRAEESWCGLLLPYATHGNVNWAPDGTSPSLFADLGPRPKPGRPILVLTTLGIAHPGEGLVQFARGTRAVREAFSDLPSVVLEELVLPDQPGLDGPTLTLWENEAEIVNAAYRSEPHRSAMKVADHPDIGRGSFTRMSLLWAEGSWQGVDLHRKGAVAT